MRPAGEVRQVLFKAAQDLAAERDNATCCEIAERAQVGYLVARRTVENMTRAGLLEVVGTAKRAHARHWMNLYAPKSNFATASTDTSALGAVAHAWVRGA